MRVTALRGRVYTALAAAIICVLAPVALPIGPVPITLATFVIYVAGAALGARRGAAAVALYAAIGTVGLPVFSGFSGGVHVLAGPTGGYIAGYILCAAASGFFADAAARREARGVFGRAERSCLYAAGMVTGTLLCYTMGTAWFVLRSGSTLDAALAVCVLPFLPLDAVKIAAASIISPMIRARIQSV
jgi:biotin transport system substrate-specific component